MEDSATSTQLEVFQCANKFCTLRVLTPGGKEPRHKCPYLGGTSVYRSWGLVPLSEEQEKKSQVRGKSLLELLWDELDKITSHIMGGASPIHTTLHLKGQAVGLAKAIIIFHQPFFSDVQSVAREALARHNAGQAGEEYQTIGIAERRFEMPRTAREAANPRIDPYIAEIQKIPDQHKSVIIRSPHDAKQMAKLFGCSERAVEIIREQATKGNVDE